LLKILLIILLFSNLAYGESLNTVVSTTRLEDTFDSNNNRISYLEQNIKFETSNNIRIPRLNYIHRHAYGVSVNSDFNSNSSNSAVNNFFQVYTAQVGSAMIHQLRTTYVYQGGYDFKGNTSNDFDFDVRKDIPLSELFISYAAVGYSHEQRTVTMNSQQFSINNRDLFYKIGVSYNRPNYKIGIHVKNAYSIGSGFSNIDFRMNTVAIYSVFNFD
jgi:hypothetical protein